MSVVRRARSTLFAALTLVAACSSGAHPDAAAPDARDAAALTDAPAFDAPSPPADAPASPDVPALDAPASPDVPALDTAPDAALPYPVRTAYRIKSLQPDFWPNADEVVGNNTGGVAMNLVWQSWEPAVRAPPCDPSQIEYGGHCFDRDAAVDDAIAQWSARGLAVTGVVYGSPAWARARRTCTPVSPGYEIFCAPDDPADFARFVGMLARRFDARHGRGRVVDFVIWNEVNSNDWFDVGCGQSAGACDPTTWIAAYAALYNAAFDAAMTEQPAARVLISLEHHFGAAFDAPGNTASPLLSGETFLRGFGPRVAPRAWRVAYHPYPPDLLAPAFGPDDDPRVTYGNLGELPGWLRRTYPDVPSTYNEIELTESGINSLAPRSSPAAQAAAVCDTFRNVLGTPGIDNYVYHRMTDHPVEVAAGLGLGLHNADGSAKPAWAVWALANRNDLTPPMLSCGFEDLPYTRLRRSYDPARGHWASSRIAPASFHEERAFRLYRDAQPGAIMLYECRVARHNMLTRDPNCEGQQPLGPVGYAFADPHPGTAALYRCRMGAGTDHFVSPDPGCEGQIMESLLGYVLP